MQASESEGVKAIFYNADGGTAVLTVDRWYRPPIALKHDRHKSITRRSVWWFPKTSQNVTVGFSSNLEGENTKLLSTLK